MSQASKKDMCGNSRAVESSFMFVVNMFGMACTFTLPEFFDYFCKKIMTTYYERKERAIDFVFFLEAHRPMNQDAFVVIEAIAYKSFKELEERYDNVFSPKLAISFDTFVTMLCPQFGRLNNVGWMGDIERDGWVVNVVNFLSEIQILIDFYWEAINDMEEAEKEERANLLDIYFDVSKTHSVFSEISCTCELSIDSDGALVLEAVSSDKDKDVVDDVFLEHAIAGCIIEYASGDISTTNFDTLSDDEVSKSKKQGLDLRKSEHKMSTGIIGEAWEPVFYDDIGQLGRPIVCNRLYSKIFSRYEQLYLLLCCIMCFAETTFSESRQAFKEYVKGKYSRDEVFVVMTERFFSGLTRFGRIKKMLRFILMIFLIVATEYFTFLLPVRGMPLNDDGVRPFEIIVLFFIIALISLMLYAYYIFKQLKEKASNDFNNYALNLNGRFQHIEQKVLQASEKFNNIEEKANVVKEKVTTVFSWVAYANIAAAVYCLVRNMIFRLKTKKEGMQLTESIIFKVFDTAAIIVILPMIYNMGWDKSMLMWKKLVSFCQYIKGIVGSYKLLNHLFRAVDKDGEVQELAGADFVEQVQDVADEMIDRVETAGVPVEDEIKEGFPGERSSSSSSSVSVGKWQMLLAKEWSNHLCTSIHCEKEENVECNLDTTVWWCPGCKEHVFSCNFAFHSQCNPGHCPVSVTYHRNTELVAKKEVYNVLRTYWTAIEDQVHIRTLRSAMRTSKWGTALVFLLVISGLIIVYRLFKKSDVKEGKSKRQLKKEAKQERERSTKQKNQDLIKEQRRDPTTVITDVRSVAAPVKEAIKEKKETQWYDRNGHELQNMSPSGYELDRAVRHADRVHNLRAEEEKAMRGYDDQSAARSNLSSSAPKWDPSVTRALNNLAKGTLESSDSNPPKPTPLPPMKEEVVSVKCDNPKCNGANCFDKDGNAKWHDPNVRGKLRRLRKCTLKKKDGTICGGDHDWFVCDSVECRYCKANGHVIASCPKVSGQKKEAIVNGQPFVVNRPLASVGVAFIKLGSKPTDFVATNCTFVLGGVVIPRHLFQKDMNSNNEVVDPEKEVTICAKAIKGENPYMYEVKKFKDGVEFINDHLLFTTKFSSEFVPQLRINSDIKAHDKVKVMYWDVKSVMNNNTESDPIIIFKKMKMFEDASSVMEVDFREMFERATYHCSTEGGACGAPVFDVNGKVCGFHNFTNTTYTGFVPLTTKSVDKVNKRNFQ